MYVLEPCEAIAVYIERKAVLEKIRRFKLLRADIEHIPLPDRSTDLAVVGSIPEELAPSALTELGRVAANVLLIENSPLSPPLAETPLTNAGFRPDSVESTVGRSVASVVHPDDVERTRASFARRLEGATGPYPLRLVRKLVLPSAVGLAIGLAGCGNGSPAPTVHDGGADAAVAADGPGVLYGTPPSDASTASDGLGVLYGAPPSDAS